MKFFCVVPFYNEQQYLENCVLSLLSQTDTDFTLILVDNASTDESVAIVKSLLKSQKALHWEVITEKVKGTGSAVDTGFRYAIKSGATHILRTDADCVAQSDWVAQARGAVTNDDVLLLGKPGYQKQDGLARWYDPFMFWFAVQMSQLHGRLFIRSKEYKGRHVLGAGNNMLISSSLYLRSGGFPRLPLETQDDDVALFDAVRRITPHIFRVDTMKSGASLRRIRKHGYLKTMLYYWNRKYTPSVVDIR